MPIDSQIFNPGLMRHIVVLQEPTIVRGPDGSEIKDYQDTATVRAEINFGTGREFFNAKSVNADLTHMVTIRYRQGLGPDWRAKFDDPLEGTTRLLDIRSIEPVGTMRRFQRLQCRELVGLEPQS